MPIKQIKSQHDLSLKHAEWLKSKFKNVEHHLLEMDKIFSSFSKVLNNFENEHGFANSRARLRIATLYQVAAANFGIMERATKLKILALAFIQNMVMGELIYLQ